MNYYNYDSRGLNSLQVRVRLAVTYSEQPADSVLAAVRPPPLRPLPLLQVSAPLHPRAPAAGMWVGG